MLGEESPFDQKKRKKNHDLRGLERGRSELIHLAPKSTDEACHEPRPGGREKPTGRGGDKMS